MTLQAFATSFSPPDHEPIEGLKKIRTQCWLRFLELGHLNSHHENYQYIRLPSILSNQYEMAKNAEIPKDSLFVLDECLHSHLVFVNGYLRLDLSDLTALPKGSFILPLSQAARTYSALLTTRFSKLLKEETDPFALLNGAQHQDGAFLYLAPKQIIETPIQILSVVTTTQEYTWIMPRLHSFVGKHSEATIINTNQLLCGQNCLYNASYDFDLDENAKVTLAHVDLGNESVHQFSFDTYRAQLKRNARFDAVQMTDSEKSRRDWNVILAGENSEANLSGLWFLNEQKESHTNVLVEHQEPHTRSMQLYKGVLDNQAQASFQGKILVRQKAQKTQAYQLNNNLILSDKAQANSKPNLEIFADDVKASHGATVGQLDQEQLFYLRTRGIQPAHARSILIRGFCEELLAKLPAPSLQKACLEHLRQFCEMDGLDDRT